MYDHQWLLWRGRKTPRLFGIKRWGYLIPVKIFCYSYFKIIIYTEAHIVNASSMVIDVVTFHGWCFADKLHLLSS